MTEDNRIPEIRAVLGSISGNTNDEKLTRIRAILDGAPPAPTDDTPHLEGVPAYAERVLGVHVGEVIGWVWPDPTAPQTYWCAAYRADESAVYTHNVANQHHRTARDRAIGWVLQSYNERADRASEERAILNDAVTVVSGLLASHEQQRINQDQLQARIDAALAVCGAYREIRTHKIARILRGEGGTQAVRAALQGDQ